jgi:hypothetical protein
MHISNPDIVNQIEFVQGILSTVPQFRMSLSVVWNGVTPNRLFKNFRHGSHHYGDREDDKFKIIKRLFQHEDTNYVLWLDDSVRIVEPSWLNQLGVVVAKQKIPVGMFGPKYVVPIDDSVVGTEERWLKQQPWYQGRPMRNLKGLPASVGPFYKHFVSSWCFLISRKAIDAGIPCDQCDETIMGEQLYQAGLPVMSFNTQHQVIGRKSNALTLSDVPSSTWHWRGS